MSLNKAIAESFVLWESTWRPPKQPDQVMVQVWASAFEGYDPDEFRRLAQIAIKRCKFWPSPAEVMDLSPPSPPCHREFKALPMPDEPPITPQQRKEILESMSPGGRQLFCMVVYGDETGTAKRLDN